MHPQVHAAGELAWHRREAALSAEVEPRSRRGAARTMLAARARLQRRAVHRARLVVAPSARFASDLAADCGVAPQRIRVVPNPIDLERYRPA
jgi:glycosyltransferase involved in cell wall biosynthesis